MADDFEALGAGCFIDNIRANIIEDAGWTHDGRIEVTVYGDTGNGPGPIVESVTTDFTRIDTGDVYFGRRDYEYWVEGLEIDLEPGTFWIGLRNPGGGGAGTNYWLTSDGGLDGPGSDTGWFSLDAGRTWSPEGDGWHRAFILLETEAVGACCDHDGTCADDVREDECADRFEPEALCEDLDPPCEPIGGCCLPERACPDREWVCDGDVDGDGQVNPTDSGLVQAAFGSTDERDLCQYDIDCDEQINPLDSGLVQALFGTCDPPRPPCFTPERCEVLVESECQVREGLFLGGGTDCEGDPCGG